jgi:hypothetical protein
MAPEYQFKRNSSHQVVQKPSQEVLFGHFARLGTPQTALNKHHSESYHEIGNQEQIANSVSKDFRIKMDESYVK